MELGGRGLRKKGQKGRMKTKRKWAKSRKSKSFQKGVISEVKYPRKFQKKVRARSWNPQRMS